MSGILADNTGRASGLLKSTAAGGMWTKVATQTASSDTEIDFTTLSTDYRDFQVIGSNLKVSADSDVKWRVNAGSGFVTATDYRTAISGTDDNASSFANRSGGSDNMQLNYSAWANDAAFNGAIRVVIFDVHSTSTHKMCSIDTNFYDSGSELNCLRGGGCYDGATTAIIGLRITPNTGNWASGTFTLYGRAN
jgi:hypothetical protein